MADHSSRQFHVGLAVAYNVWHYWQVTADFGFLVSYGAEMLIEIARFWVGLASWDSAERRFDIRGVMGPDEFHDGYPGRPGEGIDNCTYVNVMASWSIRRALDAYDIVGHDDVGLWSRLEVGPGELDQWRSVANRLRVEFLDNGLLAQFHGYGKLRELDLDEYRRRYGNVGRLDLILNAEGDSCAEYKVSKQADVLMLLYLFTAEELTELLGSMGYAFDPATIPATIDYYLERTTHGSTLSRVAHAWVLARSNRIDSWEMLRTSSAADLSDTQRGTTREGIHLAAMAGSIDIVQRCYTGIDVRGDTLWLHPQLPTELRSLAFDLRYRDHHIHVRCDATSTTVSIQPSARPPISIDIDGRTYLMSGGRTVVHPSNATTDYSAITVDH
jgi:trehalose/maltose hydrolase-like predicted phosphorylase